MQQRMNLGILIGAIAGGVFGAVTALEGNIARSVGAINASLLEHFFAAFIAVPAVLYLYLRGHLTLDSTRGVLPASALVGVMGLVAVIGVAYAMPRVGVASGNMALLFGQMTVAVLIDSFGVAGYEKVPLSWPRLAGLALMILGVYLVLPRET